MEHGSLFYSVLREINAWPRGKKTIVSFKRKIDKSVLNRIHSYVRDDGQNRVDFNGKTLTIKFLLQEFLAGFAQILETKYCYFY